MLSVVCGREEEERWEKGGTRGAADADIKKDQIKEISEWTRFFKTKRTFVT